MDRRRFLFGAAAASLAPFAPLSAGAGLPAAQSPPDVLLVGAGRSGVAVIDSLGVFGVRSAERIALHTWPQPAAIPEDVSRAEDVPAIERIVSDVVSRLRKIPPTTVVVAALAGRTASMSIHPLLELLALRTSVHVVALLPSVEDGWPWTRRAERALWAICRRAAGFSVIEEQEVWRGIFRGLGVPWLEFLHRRLASAAVRGLSDPGSRVATCSVPGEDFAWPGRREVVSVTPQGETGAPLAITACVLRIPGGYEAAVEGFPQCDRFAGATPAEARAKLVEGVPRTLTFWRKRGLSPQDVIRNLSTFGYAKPLLPSNGV